MEMDQELTLSEKEILSLFNYHKHHGSKESEEFSDHFEEEKIKRIIQDLEIEIQSEEQIHNNSENTSNENSNISKKRILLGQLTNSVKDLKEHEIKENAICEEELCRKCKFKKIDGYIKRTEWEYLSKCSSSSSSSSDNKIIIELWAKDDGLANYENKYEFPPPVDNELFFGACALIARNNKNNYKNMLAKVYEIHLNINET